VHSAKSSCETYYSPINKLPKDIKDRIRIQGHSWTQGIKPFLSYYSSAMRPFCPPPRDSLRSWWHPLDLWQPEVTKLGYPFYPAECFRLPLRILPCSEGAACNQPDTQLSWPRFNLKPANRTALWKYYFAKATIESIEMLRSGKFSSYLSNVCNCLPTPAALKNWTPEKCLADHGNHQHNLLYWVKPIQ